MHSGEAHSAEHRRYPAAVFDLDGVIVDTAKYHYLAWKRLSNELGFDFTERDNERLKGVSRMSSLEILLGIGGLDLDEAEKTALARKKNGWYVEYIRGMDESELLPGAREYLRRLREKGVKIALGSASKNAPTILDRLRIVDLFDAVVDGNKTSKAKPDPEVFLLAAQELGVDPADCVVFEDAEAGLQAARAAGMYAIGVGDPGVLKSAHDVIAGLHAASVEGLFQSSYQESHMIQWTTGSIATRGTNLHYYRSGGAKPPLVLVHGVTDDGLCWLPVAEVLSGEYDVIMVDLRGHGKSDAPEEGYDLVTMATELSGLITGLGLEAPAIVGHSLGAATTMTLAGLTTDLPRAIALEDPPAFWRERPPSPEEAEAQAQMRIWFDDLKRKTRDDLLEIARSENPVWSEAEIDPWADSKHRFSPRISQIVDPQETVPEDFPALLGQITCPVLLITADPDRGAILADDDVAGLQKLLPHLEVADIPGAGHNIRREQFVSYMDVIQRFLSADAR